MGDADKLNTKLSRSINVPGTFWVSQAAKTIQSQQAYQRLGSGLTAPSVGGGTQWPIYNCCVDYTEAIRTLRCFHHSSFQSPGKLWNVADCVGLTPAALNKRPWGIYGFRWLDVYGLWQKAIELPAKTSTQIRALMFLLSGFRREDENDLDNNTQHPYHRLRMCLINYMDSMDTR